MILDKKHLKLIPNSAIYFDYIRELRTDPEISIGFISQEKITREQQLQYMKNNGKNYYICVFKNKPIGFIGIVDNDLRLAVQKDFQRKGIATFMIEELIKIKSKFSVKVKTDNLPSIKFFEKNGFQKKMINNTDKCFIMVKNND